MPFFRQVVPLKKSYMDLTQQQWVDRQKEHQAAVILDVRTPDEFEEKHIPNAQLLDINDPPAFMAGLEGLDPSKAYFVYCHQARSARACQIMGQMGFATTFNLLGDLEWRAPPHKQSIRPKTL